MQGVKTASSGTNSAREAIFGLTDIHFRKLVECPECNISRNNHITQDVRSSNCCIKAYATLWQIIFKTLPWSMLRASVWHLLWISTNQKKQYLKHIPCVKRYFWLAKFLTSSHMHMHRVIFYISNTLTLAASKKNTMRSSATFPTLLSLLHFDSAFCSTTQHLAYGLALVFVCIPATISFSSCLFAVNCSARHL